MTSGVNLGSPIDPSSPTRTLISTTFSAFRLLLWPTPNWIVGGFLALFFDALRYNVTRNHQQAVSKAYELLKCAWSFAHF
jgi:hypothetical protein